MKLLDLIFPPRCMLCRQPLPGGVPVSLPCAACLTAHPPLTGSSADFGVCRAPFHYKGRVRSALLRFKFQGKTWYAAYFGDVMARCVLDGWPPDSFDLVAWVPCHWLRRLRRGYDQAELLARQVAARLSLPAEALLVKRKNVRSQTRQPNVLARRQNVAGAFACRPGPVPGAGRVLLVDDICTTRATLEECKTVLLHAGFSHVSCVVVACAHAREDCS